jgi:hypothetical protein
MHCAGFGFPSTLTIVLLTCALQNLLLPAQAFQSVAPCQKWALSVHGCAWEGNTQHAEPKPSAHKRFPGFGACAYWFASVEDVEKRVLAAPIANSLKPKAARRLWQLQGERGCVSSDGCAEDCGCGLGEPIPGDCALVRCMENCVARHWMNGDTISRWCDWVGGRCVDYLGA